MYKHVTWTFSMIDFQQIIYLYMQGLIYTLVDNSGSSKCKAGTLSQDKPDDLHKTECDYTEIQHKQQVSTTVSSVHSSDDKPGTNFTLSHIA